MQNLSAMVPVCKLVLKVPPAKRSAAARSRSAQGNLPRGGGGKAGYRSVFAAILSDLLAPVLRVVLAKVLLLQRVKTRGEAPINGLDTRKENCS